LYKHVLDAGKAGYKITSIGACFNRIGFLLDSFKHRKLLKIFINEIDKLGYSQLFRHEMPLLIVARCPYIHNQWEVEQRLKVILQHYKIIKNMPCILNFVDDKPRIILDLSNYLAGTFITLDKAKWFVREGEIVLNLFKEDERLMSLAFTFSKLNNELVLYIGALQGMQPSNESLEMLKQVTKSLEGLRPADLLLEVLRAIALNVGVKQILAISDEHRHHRHKYFGKLQESMLKTNYNEKWIENQGVLLESGFYNLPVKKIRKDISEVSSHKRALYRRRYEMLDILEKALKDVLRRNDSDLNSFELEFPITVQQKVIDLNPEKTVLAKAMFDTANYQIRFGEFGAAKRTLHTLIRQYPNLEITQSAKKRLNALEVVKAIESASKVKRNRMIRKNRLKPDNTNNKI
jgi:uncharacterized protein VirK/YbjX